jgi:hypothetical protein
MLITLGCDVFVAQARTLFWRKKKKKRNLLSFNFSRGSRGSLFIYETYM